MAQLASEHLRGNFDDFERLGVLSYVKKDPKTFAYAIKEAGKDNKIIKRNRLKQYAYARDNYDWKAVSERLFRYLYSIANKNRD